jgi:hypothetical protein
VSISAILLKQVKLGEWMEDIQVVCKRCRENWAKISKQIEEERLAEKASQIDLGKYGD